MNVKIFILTDKVHAGKSTALKKWMLDNESVAGLLCPVENGLKSYLDIASNELFSLEIKETQNSDDIQIGKYCFLKFGFEKAQAVLNKIPLGEFKYIVIDEIGNLELNGKGLEPALSILLNKHRPTKTKFVLVVRDYLLEEVILKYQIQNPEIIGIQDLNTLD